MSAKKQGYSPRTVQGVNLFHHFSRQRLRPYGEIKKSTPDSVMLEKATPINCEYVIRSVVALSEMADTISSNVGILRETLRNTDKSKMIREVEKMDEGIENAKTYQPSMTSKSSRI